MNEERRFVAAEESVGASRRFVSDVIGDLPREVRDPIVLMVSELVTNALVHATGGFRMRMERTGTELRVSVFDGGDGIGWGAPSMQSPRLDDPQGRGLRIVDRLSDEWGTSDAPDGVGHLVWFRVLLVGQRPRRGQPTPV